MAVTNSHIFAWGPGLQKHTGVEGILGTVVLTPSGWHSLDTASLKCGNTHRHKCQTLDSTGAWVGISFYIRFNDNNVSGDNPFLQLVDVDDTNRIHLQLLIQSLTDGDLTLVDADGTEVVTVEDLIQADTWYRFDVILTQGASDTYVWFRPANKIEWGQPLWAGQAGDWYHDSSTGFDVQWWVGNPAWSTAGSEVFLGPGVSFRDTAGTIEEVQRLGPFIGRQYGNDTFASRVPDNGETLDGTATEYWEHGGEVTDSTKFVYQNPAAAGGDKAGTIDLDDGSLDGPGNDSNFASANATKLFTSAAFRMLRQEGKGTMPTLTAYGKWGSSASTAQDSPNEDNFGSITTNYANYLTVLNEITDSGDITTEESNVGNLGIRANFSCPAENCSLQQWLYCVGMVLQYILFLPTKLVQVGNRLVEVLDES